VFKSAQTGLWCRLAALSPGTELGMVCDQPTAATAQVFTYTGSGLTVDGVPMVSPAPGAPLVLANTTIAAVSPDADNLSFPLAGPPLPANVAINVQTSTGTYVVVSNLTSFATTANGTGTTALEQFIATNPSSPDSTTIAPGEEAILRSLATSAYCRLTPMPYNSSQLGMVCDQPSASTATVLTYTGSGLRYNGMALVTTAPGGALLLANTTSSPATPESANLTFPVAITGGGSRSSAACIALQSCVKFTTGPCDIGGTAAASTT
jgi:hypothetical protein